MPFFKTTKNIFIDPWNDDFFSENWSNLEKAFIPETRKWDYSRELNIEDVSLWEVIYQEGGGKGFYASYDPYAEFYLLTPGWFLSLKDRVDIKTYYGPGSMKKAYKKALEWGMPIQTNKVWVENEEMFLYDY